MAAGLSLLAASQWLHAPSVEYLLPFAVATVAALIAALRTRGVPRWWARACSTLLIVAAGLAIPAQRDLWRVSHDWTGWRHESAMRGLDALGRALDEATAWAVSAAHDALAIPADRGDAFDALRERPLARDESGIAVFQGDSAFAWSGTIRPQIDLSRLGPSVVATPENVPFYLAIEVVERRGDRASAAVALIDAVAPADRLSHPLARRVAAEAGLSGFLFEAASDSAPDAEVLRYTAGDARLFDVRAVPLVQGEVAQRISERVRARAGLAFLLALACFVIGVWRGTRAISQRAAALATGLACTALVPLNQFSNLTRLFDPAVYFTPKGGPLTGNAGALAITSALALLGVLAVFRRQRQRSARWGPLLTVLLVAGLGPFLLRELARGVQIPPHGVDATLWLMWEIPLFLAAVSVLLAGTAAGATLLGPRRGLAPWVAPLGAAIAALLAPIVWEAPGRFPWWYTFLWVAAIGMLAFSRRTRAVILSASTVAALGATTLVWGRTSRGRVDAAVRDLSGLSQVDSVGVALLYRFGTGLSADLAPTSRQALLQHFVASDIASAGNPVALFAWPTDSGAVASFQTAQIPIAHEEMARLVAHARQTRDLIVEPVPTDTTLELMMAAPSAYGGVTAVVLAPKSRLFEPDPFARLLGLEVDPDVEPPYTVRLRERAPVELANGPATWRRDRDGSELHGDWVVRTGTGASQAHAEVELRPLDTLVQRGALIVLLNLAIVGLLWMVSVIADGGGGRWFRARRRRWARSYRTRLSLALFAFFVLPATAFAIWSYEQLATDATQSRAVLVRETLRALVPPQRPLWLPAESDRLDTPLFMYYSGELTEASDSLLDDIAPIGRFLNHDAEVALGLRGEATDTRLERVDGASLLFGYRSFNDEGRSSIVIAAPARADELALGRRRRDLGVLVLFATAVGGLAAFWLSGIAARQLARPIGTLRAAALSIAGGARTPPLETEPTVEFSPVFTAFRRMTADLNASRTALEEAQRRTTAVLRNVASGVIAVDPDGRVSLANPSAETLVGGALTPGTAFASRAPAEVSTVVERFLKAQNDEEEFEIGVDQRQLRGTLTRLARGGAVITLDDVTELARAQRVIAWGEMARQVAHEIKNPLTPIRLGVQHLRRARADARVDFDRVLDQNVNQILAEIDRLDEIARSFSRYGAAPEERPVAGPVDVASIVREVVSLERMGAQRDLAWSETGVDIPIYALARADELKEVLLNVLENARLAQARAVTAGIEVEDGRVQIAVKDDGQGIAPDVLPRIFEPHFSTRTSGSGLGLAISRRLVEGWGGAITVDSTLGVGTTVTVALLRAAPG